MPQLREVLDAVQSWYDPRWAESWDAVGLVCGDPDDTVTRIQLAIDAVPPAYILQMDFTDPACGAMLRICRSTNTSRCASTVTL